MRLLAVYWLASRALSKKSKKDKVDSFIRARLSGDAYVRGVGARARWPPLILRPTPSLSAARPGPAQEPGLRCEPGSQLLRAVLRTVWSSPWIRRCWRPARQRRRLRCGACLRKMKPCSSTRPTLQTLPKFSWLGSSLKESLGSERLTPCHRICAPAPATPKPAVALPRRQVPTRVGAKNQSWRLLWSRVGKWAPTRITRRPPRWT